MVLCICAVANAIFRNSFDLSMAIMFRNFAMHDMEHAQRFLMVYDTHNLYILHYISISIQKLQTTNVMWYKELMKASKCSQNSDFAEYKHDWSTISSALKLMLKMHINCVWEWANELMSQSLSLNNEQSTIYRTLIKNTYIQKRWGKWRGRGRERKKNSIMDSLALLFYTLR